MIREIIKKSPRLYDIVARLRPTNAEIEGFYESLPPGIRFIQIGASDGMRWDPVRKCIIKNNWTGVFVEPEPFSFRELKKNYRYRSQRFQFINAAVSEAAGTLEFWTCKDDYLLPMSKKERFMHLRKSSFLKDNLLEMCDEADLHCIHVDLVSVNSLLSKYHSNLLVIDAEGFDEQIIRSIDFQVHQPAYIVFEAYDGCRERMFQYLATKGYDCSRYGGDCAAVRRQAALASM